MVAGRRNCRDSVVVRNRVSRVVAHSRIRRVINKCISVSSTLRSSTTLVGNRSKDVVVFCSGAFANRLATKSGVTIRKTLRGKFKCRGPTAGGCSYLVNIVPSISGYCGFATRRSSRWLGGPPLHRGVALVRVV